MGTYTANKNLYMPTVGDQGWGDLMNTNLSTIDTFLKPITVSGSTYTFTGNLVGNQSGGSVSATSISNSGTSTFTGKITANGGIGTKALTATSISNSGTLTQTGTSTFTGKITANGGIGTTSLTTSSTITSTGLIVANSGVKGVLYIGGTVGTSGDVNYATCAVQNGTGGVYTKNDPLTIKINNYSIVFGNPQKVAHGIYCKRSDLTGTLNPSASTRNVTVTWLASNSSEIIYNPDDYWDFASPCIVYWKYNDASSWTKLGTITTAGNTLSFTATVGKTVQIYGANGSYRCPIKASVAATTTYKVKYATP